MNEYKNTIKEMYERINAFVQDHPDIEEEVIDQEEEFFRLSLSGVNNPGQLFFDWFIFDYKLPKYNKRLFDVFLREMKKEIPDDLCKVYAKAGKDTFSFFKVKAVKIGKQFIAEDILTGSQYRVFETSATKFIGKGDYLIGRLLAFDEAFIVASQCLFYPQKDYDIFGMLLKNISRAPSERLDAFDVYKALFPQVIPEQLSAKEKFELLCKEGGLSDDDIEDILLEIRIAIKDKKTVPPQQVLSRWLKKLRPPQEFDMEEFMDTFTAMWNKLAGEIYPATDKGPLEIALINLCMQTIQHEFPLPDNPTKKELQNLSKKSRQLMDKWYITPRKELAGKSPKEIILQERAQLGNPQKDFGFEFNIERSVVDEHMEKQGEKLFYEAGGYMKSGKYEKALACYEKYLKLWDGNHVVWHNMAVCHVMLLQKRKAEQCLKQALTLKPDYKLALDKYEELTSMYKEDMVEMVRVLRKNQA